MLRMVCFCAEISPIPTRTRVVILRHVLEGRRGSNTARLVTLALPNASMQTFGAPGAELEGLPVDSAVVLFPDGRPTGPPDPPPATLVVVDGSWAQARRMRQRIPGVRDLPTWSLPPPDVTRPRLRHPFRDGMVSTVEAIAQALRLLEGEAPAAALEDVYDRFLAAQVRSGRRL